MYWKKCYRMYSRLGELRWVLCVSNNYSNFRSQSGAKHTDGVSKPQPQNRVTYIHVVMFTILCNLLTSTSKHAYREQSALNE